MTATGSESALHESLDDDDDLGLSKADLAVIWREEGQRILLGRLTHLYGIPDHSLRTYNVHETMLQVLSPLICFELR